MDGSSTTVQPGRFRPGPTSGTLLPDYRGLGLANVVPTVERHFGLASPIPPLSADALPPALLDGVETVATLLIDALGYDRLSRALELGRAPHLAALRDRASASLAPITSTFPSTTVTALTTLGTGLPPGRHGITGDKVYDADLGTIVGVMGFASVPAGRSLGDLGVDPAGWVGLPTVYERLAGVGVASVVLDHAEYENSPLSSINHRGAQFVGCRTISELCAKLRAAIEAGAGRAYIHAYWGNLDTAGHSHGAGSGEYGAELGTIDRAIGRILLAGLRSPRTLLLILADHGQIDIAAERWTWLNDHPDLLALLQLPPTGDHRAAVLHPRPGREAEARGYIERRLAHCAHVLSADEAVELGLYGPGPLSARARQRIGQLLVLAREDWVVRYEYPGKERRRWQIGTHGGLAGQEMLVPLLALRLD